MKTFYIIIFSYFFLISNCTFAQNTLITAGGNSESASGQVSYSIGQVLYSIQNTSDNYLIQGVQQPYEILLVTTNEEIDEEVLLSISPNPTSDLLVVNMKNINGVVAELFDSTGKMITRQAIVNLETTFKIGSLIPNIYLLRISKYGKHLKTFKIVKQ